MPTETEGQLTRRQFLVDSSRLTAYAVTASTVGFGLRSAYDHRYDLATAVGEFLDNRGEATSFRKPIAVLEPRKNDVPQVKPVDYEKEPIGISLVYRKEERKGLPAEVTVQLPEGLALQSEHTHVPLKDRTFSRAGIAILTSAEGLEQGKQEYCAMFRSGDEIVAVGYEKGLYTFDPTLKEWVRVITYTNQQIHSATPWEEQDAGKSLIEDVSQGIDTLNAVGYKPWAAVLASTKMPQTTPQSIAAESFARSIEDATVRNTKFVITENGDLLDMDHMSTKVYETLGLFGQLYYQSLTDVSKPKAKVNYTLGQVSDYRFSVDKDSLKPDVLLDTTFQLMTQANYLMEGVTQRYFAEKLPVLGELFKSVGMQAEDMFSDTVGVAAMVKAIKEKGLREKLRAPLLALHQRFDKSTPLDEMLDVINAEIPRVMKLLVDEVIITVLETYGIKSDPPAVDASLPLGLYPLIPTKIVGNNPTHIDLGGINPTNQAVQFEITHATAIGPNLHSLADKI